MVSDCYEFNIHATQKSVKLYPVVVSRHLMICVNVLMTFTTNNHEVLGGKMTDYVCVKLQNHGSPHLCLKEIRKLMKFAHVKCCQTTLEFLNSYIITCILAKRMTQQQFVDSAFRDKSSNASSHILWMTLSVVEDEYVS